MRQYYCPHERAFDSRVHGHRKLYAMELKLWRVDHAELQRPNSL
jgi:hypothetical protein